MSAVCAFALIGAVALGVAAGIFAVALCQAGKIEDESDFDKQPGKCRE